MLIPAKLNRPELLGEVEKISILLKSILNRLICSEYLPSIGIWANDDCRALSGSRTNAPPAESTREKKRNNKTRINLFTYLHPFFYGIPFI